DPRGVEHALGIPAHRLAPLPAARLGELAQLRAIGPRHAPGRDHQAAPRLLVERGEPPAILHDRLEQLDAREDLLVAFHAPGCSTGPGRRERARAPQLVRPTASV